MLKVMQSKDSELRRRGRPRKYITDDEIEERRKKRCEYHRNYYANPVNKACHAIRTKRWNRANAARISINSMLWSARSRAKSKGISFDLEKADCTIPKIC